MISCTKWFDFNRAYIIPIKRSFDRLVPLFKFNEKPKVNTIDTRTWTNSKATKLLSQELKNQDEEVSIRQRNAKGLIRTKTWSIIYLRAYVKRRFISPKVVKDLIIPSKEKSEKPTSARYTEELIFVIRFEKDISHPKEDFPSVLISSVTIETIFIISAQIHKEEFIKAIKIIDLNINCVGLWLLEYIKWENKKFAA